MSAACTLALLRPPIHSAHNSGGTTRGKVCEEGLLVLPGLPNTVVIPRSRSACHVDSWTVAITGTVLLVRAHRGPSDGGSSVGGGTPEPPASPGPACL